MKETWKASKLPDEILKKIKHEILKYPEDQKRSAVLMTLGFIQKSYGQVTDWHMKEVSDLLEMPLVEVNEVVAFYDLLSFEKKSQYVIKVCDSVSCYLCQSGKIVDHLKKRLQVNENMKCKDGLFTIETAPCLAKCANAPVLIVNDEQYHLNMDQEKVDQMITTYENQARSKNSSEEEV